MKYLRLLAVFLLVLLCFSLSVSAKGEREFEKFYAEQYKNSGADKLSDSLPDKAEEYFDKYGIDPSDYNWVSSFTAENVFGHIFGFIRDGAKAPLRAGAAIIAIILVTAALRSAEFKSSAVNAAVYASVVAAAAAVAYPVYSVISAATDALKGTSVFMLSFIPVLAVITAASGATATSASMSTLLLAAAQGVAFISNFVVLPLMGGYSALGICGAISPVIKSSDIAETVKKLALWIMAFISTVFAAILGIQTAVNSSADTLVSKSAKFIIGSAVPVAGGVLSEAFGTVTASMGLLRSSVGIYGAAVCILTFLPLAVELLMWRAVLLTASGVSKLFSLPELSGLLKAVDSMLSLISGIMFLVATLFIISLAVVVSAGKVQ